METEFGSSAHLYLWIQIHSVCTLILWTFRHCMNFKRFQNISYQYDNVGILYNRSLKWANMYHLKMVSRGIHKLRTKLVNKISKISLKNLHKILFRFVDMWITPPSIYICQPILRVLLYISKSECTLVPQKFREIAKLAFLFYWSETVSNLRL